MYMEFQEQLKDNSVSSLKGLDVLESKILIDRYNLAYLTDCKSRLFAMSSVFITLCSNRFYIKNSEVRTVARNNYSYSRI